MKKMQISIPKPCHENWESMTPGEKGRFCGSCQKTVVDFSVMSDRQIADYLRKSTGSTCGRFHSDQLNREMVVPKKSLPWAQYLFKATWPAFVLFLKSCSDGQSVVGNIAVKKQNKPSEDAPVATLGFMLTEITPVDTPKMALEKPMQVRITDRPTIGIIEPTPSAVMGDTIILLTDPVEEQLAVKESCQPLDTVMISGYSTHMKSEFVAGGLTVVTTEKIRDNGVIAKPAEQADFSIKAFPNPVKPGGEIRLEFASPETVLQLQIFTASGAAIPVQQNRFPKSRLISVMIPQNLTPGHYFLQVTNDKQQTSSVKILILN